MTVLKREWSTKATESEDEREKLCVCLLFMIDDWFGVCWIIIMVCDAGRVHANIGKDNREIEISERRKCKCTCVVLIAQREKKKNQTKLLLQWLLHLNIDRHTCELRSWQPDQISPLSIRKSVWNLQSKRVCLKCFYGNCIAAISPN